MAPTMKSKLKKNRIHCTNSGDTIMGKTANNKITISLVSRILDIETEVKPEKPKTKPEVKGAIKLESAPPIAMRVSQSEPTIMSEKSRAAARAPVPVTSNASLRDVGRQSIPRRPTMEDLRNDSNFKETYERLRRLGLLKARMGNYCHMGMTSPSGKTKFPPLENAKKEIGNKAARSKNPAIKKPTEIKSKFLQNNVVLKVQHYYNSQGKDLPDELKNLSRGRANRNPTATNSFTELKRRRYQVYPCTSPSSTYFTRTMKKG